MPFTIGQRVHRLENREIVGAIVVSMQSTGETTVVEIEYDEGGSGWWPETSLIAE
jgi:hypothetical protein